MKIYDKYDDVHVKAVIVYTYQGHAYADAEYTTPMCVDELKDAFLKGALIVDEGKFHKPITFELSGSGSAYCRYIYINESGEISYNSVAAYPRTEA